MKIEIRTEGKGVGSIVLIDGTRLEKVTNVELRIPATGLAVLSINKLSVNDQGLLAQEEGVLKTETFWIRGIATFEGSALGRIPE